MGSEVRVSGLELTPDQQATVDRFGIFDEEIAVREGAAE